MGDLSMTFKKTYTEQIRDRYLQATKASKTKILDEYCAICNITRKHAIRALLQKSEYLGQPQLSKRGPRPKYPAEELTEPLGRIWLMSGKQCSKYLVTMIKDWIGPYQIIYGKLEMSIINKLLAISPATIDRLLSNSKYKALRRGISGTKAGSLLKEEIVLSDNHWDDKKSGYFEADTVALCGDSVKGQFIWCLNMTDVATGWTEVRACWGKSADAILTRMKEIESTIPMPLLGCDCDNVLTAESSFFHA